MSADNDNLDDLFRQQLGPHATPPSPELARRLAELAEAERLDALFRTGLGSHASQPRREVWERLEDEHLRPQPRRRRPVVAWWQLSAAAVLLLTLLAGGLWRGGYWQPASELASRSADTGSGGTRRSTPAAAGLAIDSQSAAPTLAQATTKQALAQVAISPAKKNQEIISRQATAAPASSSSNPIATTTRPRRPATALQAAGSSQPKPRPLDAVAGQLATTGRRNGPASLPLPASPAAPAPAERPSLPVVAMTSAPEVIEVEVRRGNAPASPAPVVVAAAEPAPTRRPRLRLGSLLRQADHLVHGEPVSLAEATGLAETVTVQARFGGRTLSKTIQL